METGRSRSRYPHVKTREAFRAKQRAISAALPAQEREANRVAADNCVPTQEMISFVSRRKFFAERDIVALANKERVHPEIIVRQIHNMTGRYELLRRLQVKLREYIMPTATVDGWGHVAPVSI